MMEKFIIGVEWFFCYLYTHSHGWLYQVVSMIGNYFFVIWKGRWICIFDKFSIICILCYWSESYGEYGIIIFYFTVLFVFIILFLDTKKNKIYFIFVFSSLTIVIYGSRGTLLCIASFFFLYLMLNFRKTLEK